MTRPARLSVARLEPRDVPAALDPLFGGDGRAEAGLSVADGSLLPVAALPDGRVAVAATVEDQFGRFFGVAVFRPDGTLDPAFSGDGRAFAAFTAEGRNDQVQAVVPLTDGRLAVVGTDTLSGSGVSFVAVAVFRPDGTLDPAFSGDGLATPLGLPGGGSPVQAAPLPGGGLLLVAGDPVAALRAGGDPAAVALRADGTEDPSFPGLPRIGVSPPTVTEPSPGGLVLLSDGRLAAVGYAFLPFPDAFGIELYRADGSRTAAFGDGDFAVTTSILVSGVFARPDGGVVLTGQADAPGTTGFEVLGLRPDGSPDGRIGPGGAAAVQNRPGAEIRASGGAAVLPDGRIVLSGFALGGATARDVGLVVLAPPQDAPPTIDPVPDQTLFTAFPPRTRTVPLAVADDLTPADRLTVTAASDNPAVVPATGLSVTGTGNRRTLSIAPTIAGGNSGRATIAVTVTDGSGQTARTQFSFLLQTEIGPPSLPPRAPLGRTVTDSANGTVRLRNADRTVRATVTPFPGYAGSLRTAVADFNNDGTDDVAVGTGVGTLARLRVLDGRDGTTELFALTPFGDFGGGLYVTAGDVTGDGVPDLVVTPDATGGPRVKVIRGGTFDTVADFLGIDDPEFRNGATAAVGDVNGDGRGDVLVSAGVNGGPRVVLYDGATVAGTGTPAKLFGDFFAFDPTSRFGAYVALGDVDGDGLADPIFGTGPGATPQVRAISGADVARRGLQTPLFDFPIGTGTGGAPLAVKDLDGDGRADLVVGTGPRTAGRVTGYAGSTLRGTTAPAPLFVDDSLSGYGGGVYVG